MTVERERYARVHAILSDARTLRGNELESYLQSACDGDEELREHVDELLAAGRDEDSADVFADGRIAGVRVALEEVLDGTHSNWVPERIGDYRIVREIGRGGMGVVYEAEQESPRRRVAIKLLDPMQATPERLRRFRHEAELLGRLQHPGIAAIFEASTYDAGRGPQPFFAMELVDGLDIRAHCERYALDRDARLELLARVCDAVQYAHDRGVIHRDLKPDNVLIDGHGNPRILDFGVARASHQSTVLTTAVTAAGNLVGTLAYMAPEQFDHTQKDTSPQVDVYSLGVLAFELLVGRLPRDIADLPMTQVVTMLAKTDAPRLSTFDPRLSGDVDTIVGKALASERERRYGTPAALAADLRRLLAHQPILARPPSRVYLACKFARRNQALVGGTVATLITLSIGLVVAGVQRNLARTVQANVMRLSAFQRLADLRREADELWPATAALIDRYDDWLLRARQLADGLEPDPRTGSGGHRRQLAELVARASDDRRGGEAPRFERDEDSWWHAQLVQLIGELEGFADPDTGLIEGISAERGWGIARRKAWAMTIEERSLTGPVASRSWAEAVAAIADPARTPAYAGLRLEPQLGLLPLGPDPQSGLWEFAHLLSGEPPERDREGMLALTEETGLVFVLLPGGTFPMGAQGDDPQGRNYYGTAHVDEAPIRDITLSPFFLSKYEMTQCQWTRFAGKNPSRDFPLGSDGFSTSGYRVDGMYPVEQVSWFDCVAILPRMGLTLPTEAQWEYAVRAGTTSAWSSGDAKETLRGVANLADVYARDHLSYYPKIEEWIDDGHLGHARVGSFAPNAFGLHDLHGNLWEWCMDEYDMHIYKRSAPPDPLYDPDKTERRVFRGGSFRDDASRLRSAFRAAETPERADANLGVRPARTLR